MKKTLLLSSLMIAFGLTVPASADTKIGIVDMNRIFSSYYKTKDAEGKINENRASAKKELDERMESYKGNIETINKINSELQKPELSNDAKTKRSKERDEKINSTKELEREIVEFRTSREKELQAQALRMRDGIVKEITALIQERVKKDRYDLVLDKSGISANGVPIVIHSEEAADFSDDIITALNASKPATQPAASPAANKKK